MVACSCQKKRILPLRVRSVGWPEANNDFVRYFGYIVITRPNYYETIDWKRNTGISIVIVLAIIRADDKSNNRSCNFSHRKCCAKLGKIAQ